MNVKSSRIVIVNGLEEPVALFLNREFGVLAPVSISNGDFTLIFLFVRFYPYFIETKAPFAPPFHTVRYMSLKTIKINRKKN